MSAPTAPATVAHVLVDLRAEALTANRRVHWTVRQSRSRLLRRKGLYAAHGLPRLQRARLTVEVTWPDGRRRDVDNLRPTIKPIVDGMVDAGVLPDDDDTHLVGPDLRVSPNRTGRPGLVALVFRFEELP